MVDNDIHRSFENLEKNKQLNNYKIVWSNPKNVLKKDLINYIIYLNLLFPNIFKHQSDHFDKFLKMVNRKTKTDIVDLINYYLTNKSKNVSYKAVIKGTNNPELVKVYVKKEVHKVI
jgi:hypothetical protein